MNMGLTLTLGFMILLAVVLAVLVGGIIYMDSGGAEVVAPTQTTDTTTSTTPTTTTTTTETTDTTATSTLSTTSTTLELKTLSVSYSPNKLYKTDDVNLDIKSGGIPVHGATVFLNGRVVDQTGEFSYTILSLEGGSNEVVASHDGYYNSTLTIDVEKTTYAASQVVRRELTAAERQRAISDGKADLRVYDSPGCAICAIVIPAINKLVDRNRDCIVYERLHAFDHTSELKAFKGDYFPYIIAEGSLGTFHASGQVSMSQVKDMIERASGCSVE
ncbi:MAG: hypothetical protein V1744_02320 [Candidatus Altiarchaeota archaeon]